MKSPMVAARVLSFVAQLLAEPKALLPVDVGMSGKEKNKALIAGKTVASLIVEKVYKFSVKEIYLTVSEADIAVETSSFSSIGSFHETFIRD